MEKVKDKLDYFCGINAYPKNEDDSKLIIHKESNIKISDDPKYKDKFDISEYIKYNEPLRNNNFLCNIKEIDELCFEDIDSFEFINKDKKIEIVIRENKTVNLYKKLYNLLDKYVHIYLYLLDTKLNPIQNEIYYGKITDVQRNKLSYSFKDSNILEFKVTIDVDCIQFNDILDNETICKE